MNEEYQNLNQKKGGILKYFILLFFFLFLFLQVALSTVVLSATLKPTISYWAPGLHLSTYLPPTPTPTSTPAPSPTPFCIETCQADCGCI